MPFAVIEYSSKTGDIWRHTDDKPNYLADPLTEMDPTSFGCYVSALKGEHIPLTKLINTKKLTNRIRRKITGSWPNYSLEYLAKSDVVMVVYEVANGPTLTRFTNRLKKAYPHIKILGVPTQPYGLLKAQWEKDTRVQSDIIDFINSCDLFITIVKSTQQIWQAMTTTLTEYLPQPYPVEYAIKRHQPLAAKENIIFIPGVTDRPDIIKGHDVAKAIQQKHPDHIIHVTRINGLDLDLSHLKDTHYEVIDFQPWHQHLDYLSRVKVVINTDFTQTRGRVQMDCAAVGTPSVGSDSDAQLDLFPDQAANSNTSIEDIANLASTLISEADHYQAAVSHAQSKLDFYNYPNSASRLQSLINT